MIFKEFNAQYQVLTQNQYSYLSEMNKLHDFLQTHSTAQQQLFSRERKQPSIQLSNFKNNYKKRSASLLSIYSAKLTELTSRGLLQGSKPRRGLKKQRRQQNKERQNISNISMTRKTSPTIQNTVDLYAQQLRQTLMNQYQLQKKRSIRSHQLRKQQDKKTNNTLQAVQVVVIAPNTARENNDFNRKEMDGGLTYKTLNLLYKSIIDNSFIKRKKQQFQLQASKLPIMDRFKGKRNQINIEKEQSITSRNPQLNKNQLPYHLSNLRITRRLPNQQKTLSQPKWIIPVKRQTISLQKRQIDEQINAWNTMQQDSAY